MVRKLAQAETKWQLKVNRATNEGVDNLREAVRQHRTAQQEASLARRSAEAEAQAAEQRVCELQEILDRVRSSRTQTLLDTVEEQKNKIAELTTRRKTNQRKICDTNLDRRRAALAKEKAQQAQQALNEYCVRELRGDIDLARIEQLEGELAAVRVQLAEQTALREKYEAVAKPPGR